MSDRGLGEHILHDGIELVDREQNIRLHLVDALRQLRFAESGVEHPHVCAELVEGKDRIDRFRDGRHTDRGIVAVLHA